LADGVPLDKLYPLDIPRALSKLKELAPNIVWWHDINQGGQMLTSGEAVMSIAPSNRIQGLIDSGAPLKIIWNQNRYTFDVWYVLRGAPDADNAMRFIAFASRADSQARMAQLGGYGPTNPRALALIDQTAAKKLPTYADNYNLVFQKNEEWWKDNRQKWVEACTAALY
jgi:putative spermidine/putrescine transport system substrate-binding protein